MSDQPNALRLADELAAELVRTVAVDMLYHEAAAELRRLHAEAEAQAARIEADEALMRQALEALIKSVRHVVAGGQLRLGSHRPGVRPRDRIHPRTAGGQGMTTEAAPREVGSHEGLGPLPERCDDCRTPNSCGDGYCLEAYITSRIRQERDCRTCTRYTLHHRDDVPHCSSPIRCVDASRYERADYVQLWETAPVDAGF